MINMMDEYDTDDGNKSIDNEEIGSTSRQQNQQQQSSLLSSNNNNTKTKDSVTLRIKATTSSTKTAASSTTSSSNSNANTNNATNTNNRKVSLSNSGGNEDFDVTVRLQDTVAAVKEAVVRALSSSTSSSSLTATNDQQQPYVRLIASGRLLAPDTAPLNQFLDQQKWKKKKKLLEDDDNDNDDDNSIEKEPTIVHAVIVASDQIQKRGAQALLQQSLSQSSQRGRGSRSSSRGGLIIPRGTGVNESGWAVRLDEIDDDDDDDDDEEDTSSNTTVDGGDYYLNNNNSGSAGRGGAAGDIEQGGRGWRSSSSSNNGGLYTSSTSNRQNRRGPFHSNNNNSNTPNTNNNRRRQRIRAGFDSLRDTAGLRRSEILAIRAYFNRSIDRWLLLNPHVVAETERREPYDVLLRRRYQEEAWMQAQGPASEFRFNLSLLPPSSTFGVSSANTGSTSGATPGSRQWTLEQQQHLIQNRILQQQQQQNGLTSTTVGTDRDFVWGFLLGFFVGFLMLVWIWMPTVPHKQKLGILTGYSFHIALGMFKNGQQNAAGGGNDIGDGTDYYDSTPNHNPNNMMLLED